MFDSKLYKETFSQVRASEETLSEVLNMTQKNRHSSFRAARMILIAAVVTALLATTVFAYVGFTQYENPMELLGTFFGDEERQSSEGQIVHETYYELEYDLVQPTIERVPLDEKTAEEQVAPYISDVGKTLTSGDTTLTIIAHQYDSVTDCGVIYYTLENPNGVYGYDLQFDGEVWWPSGEVICLSDGFGKSYIIENETTNTKLSVACYYVCSEINEGYLELWFYADEGPYGVAEQSIILHLENGGGMDGLELENGDIGISPIAIRINVEHMDFLRIVDTDGTILHPRADEIDDLVIRYHDGTEYVIKRDQEGSVIANYTYALQNMYGSTVSYTFNRLVDINKVAAVIINDVEFPVS